MAAEQDERAAQEKSLFDEVLKSDELSGSPTSRALLRLLFQHKHHYLTEKEFAGLFDPPKGIGAVRQGFVVLRQQLKDVVEARPTERFRCVLPDGISGVGFKLRFYESPTPTELFWHDHLCSGLRIGVVCNEPLFFGDQKRRVVRHFDLNSAEHKDVTDQQISEVRKREGKGLSGGVSPAFFYLFRGEIGACDHLQKWFRDREGLEVRREVSRELPTEVLKGSPILLGNSKTNWVINKLMHMPDCTSLRYRMDSATFGELRILGPRSEEEEKTLKGLSARGYFDEKTGALKDNIHEDVFVLVTRIPNPFEDGGAVTIIGAEYLRAIEMMGRTLTDDGLLNAVMKRAGVSNDKPFPKTFQAVMAVRMGGENIDVAGRKARIVLAYKVDGDESATDDF